MPNRHLFRAQRTDCKTHSDAQENDPKCTLSKEYDIKHCRNHKAAAIHKMHPQTITFCENFQFRKFLANFCTVTGKFTAPLLEFTRAFVNVVIWPSVAAF